jgi:acyl transferase domain-containing protein
MAAVFAAPDVLQDILAHAHDGVAIAAINSPQNTVVSGKREAVMQLLETLSAQGITAQALTVSHAFHSSLMAPILEAFEEVARRLTYRDPNIPLISNLTGRPMAAAPDAPYWRDHVRHPVRFAEAMQTLHELGYELFLEVGPGSALLSMGRQCLPKAQATWLPSLLTRQTAWHTLLESLRQLYLQGFTINWQMVDQGLTRRRVPLPTYPFQRKRYWLETVTARHTPVWPTWPHPSCSTWPPVVPCRSCSTTRACRSPHP